MYLGVTITRTNMITLANRLAVNGDNDSNHRIRRDGIPSTLREFAGAFH
jgi:Na+-translocating ferredoxin:NAD+ oxidoreductase RnfG subunit